MGDLLFIITGHGDGDCGAVGNGFQEAERVRALAERIKYFGGDNVLLCDMTRNYYKDKLINSLDISKDYKILELHLDSDSNPSAKGGHVIIESGFKADKYDLALAAMISDMFPGRANTIVERSDLANCNRAAKKGYNYRLLENCFISNAEDIARFNANLDNIAKGILECFEIEPMKGEAGQAVPETPATNKSEGVKYKMNRVKRGSTGTDVYVFQSIMKKMGYYKKEIDGKFGGGSEDACNAFQKDYPECGTNGQPDGSFGPKCWKKALSLIGA